MLMMTLSEFSYPYPSLYPPRGSLVVLYVEREAEGTGMLEKQMQLLLVTAE